MTLGRTPTGAIKIKTDSPLGLRAVECGCCGGDICPLPSQVKITGALLDILKSATTGTCNGYSPVFFNRSISTQSMNAYWDAGTWTWLYGMELKISYYITVNFTLKEGCFSMYGYNEMNELTAGECVPLPVQSTCTATNFTINGVSLPAASNTFPAPFDTPVPVPVFVLS